MKLFEKLFKKKETKTPRIETKTLGIEELSRWLQQESKKEYEDLNFDFKKSINNIKNTIDTLSQRTEELENTTIQGTPQQKKIIDFNKNNMVKQVKTFISNTTFPDNYDYNSLADFQQKTEYSLRTCLENSMKSYQYTKTLLPSTRELIELMKQINTTLEELKKPLNSKKQTITTLTQTQELLSQLTQKNTELRTQKQENQKLTTDINQSGEKLKTIPLEIEKLKKTPEWKTYHNLLEHEKELKKTQDNILKQINLQITPLIKMLNRLEKQNKSQRHTLTDEHRQTLTQLLTTPQTAKNTTGFFKYLEELLNHDTLGINPQKTGKINTHLKTLIQNNTFEEQQAEYHKKTQEIKTIKKTIAEINVSRKKDELDKTRIDTTQQINTLRNEKNKSLKRIKQLTREKQQLEEQIQQKINTLSKNRIIFSNNQQCSKK